MLNYYFIFFIHIIKLLSINARSWHEIRLLTWLLFSVSVQIGRGCGWSWTSSRLGEDQCAKNCKFMQHMFEHKETYICGIFEDQTNIMRCVFFTERLFWGLCFSSRASTWGGKYTFSSSFCFLLYNSLHSIERNYIFFSRHVHTCCLVSYTQFEIREWSNLSSNLW